MHTSTRPGRRRSRWLPTLSHRRTTAALAALTIAATGLTGAAATTWAPTSQAADGKCVGTLTAASIDPNGTLSVGGAVINTGLDDQFVNGTQAAFYGSASFKVKVPDAATKGDTFTVTLQAPWKWLGTPANLTDSSGNTIATTQATFTAQTDGSSSHVLTFTYSDYVDSHKGVTGSYSQSIAYDSNLVKGRRFTPGVTYTGNLSGCSNGSTASASVRSAAQYNPVSPAMSMADSETGTVNTRETGHHNTKDGDLVTVTAVIGRSAGTQWNPYNLKVGLATWDGDLITAQTSTTQVSGEPTKPGTHQVIVSGDGHTLTVKVRVRKAGESIFFTAGTKPDGSDEWRSNLPKPYTIDWTETITGTDGATRATYTSSTEAMFSTSSGSGGGSALKAVTPTKPTVQADAKCGTRPGVVTPKVSGLDYKTVLSKDGNTATVTATARAGYFIPADATSTWTLTIPAAEPCPAVLTYDANGGTGSMDKVTDVIGGDVDAGANRFTRKGYTFTGWATTPGGKVTYKPSQEVTLKTASTTLYAVWTANPAKLVYDANGGTGTTAPTSGVTDQKVKVSASSFTRKGYTFTGWDTKPAGDGSDVAPGTAWTLTPGTVTLYAQWKADPASLVYDANGGTGTTPASTGKTDQKITVAKSSFKRSGYTFTGWNTKADGKGKAVKEESSWTLTPGTTTLYATWQANPAQVVYDPAGGDGSMDPTKGVTDQKVIISKSSFKRSGYTFTGWNTKTDGKGKSVAQGSSYTLTPGTTTLYATWSADPAALTYDANGGTGTTPATTGKTDQKVTVATSQFDRPGYTFTGWNTKADGKGKAVKEGADWTLTAGETTLYATWQANPAQITYDPAGGDGQMDPTEGVTDQKVTVAKNQFTRPGWRFTGWQVCDTSDQVAEGSEVTLPAGGMRLCATWVSDPAPTPVATLARTGAAATAGLVLSAGLLAAGGLILSRRTRREED